MKTNFPNPDFIPGTLTVPTPSLSVRVRMATDKDRALRIHNLKAQRPDLTWRQIADHVGVTERAANEWGRGGGISYDNCVRLAEVLGVDAGWLWRGDHEDTPELMDAVAKAEQVDVGLEEFRAHVGVMLGYLARVDRSLAVIREHLGIPPDDCELSRPGQLVDQFEETLATERLDDGEASAERPSTRDAK